MTDLKRTPRTKLNRKPSRGSYDRDEFNAILDEATLCHVGLVVDGAPRVLPMVYARIGDTLYLHGAAKGRWSPQASMFFCVTVTLLDGLVLARSGMHTGMNYRCAVLYGEARWVEDKAEKHAALRAFVEHALPGRSDVVRGPTDDELIATSVLCIPIDEGSVKTRTGDVDDVASDIATVPCWAGVIPFHMQAGTPEPDAHTSADKPAPTYSRPKSTP